MKETFVKAKYENIKVKQLKYPPLKFITNSSKVNFKLKVFIQKYYRCKWKTAIGM